MAKTMEQYMSKTETDYGSGVARPKIDNNDQFELKGQFLKELRENTFSGSDNEDANEHIEKVLKIVDLFHVPNITVDQLMLRVFPISLTGTINMQEVILFYNGLDVPTRQILDSRGAIPTMTTADAKKAIQEMAEYSQKWHNGTSRGRTQVGCEQCKGPHYTKDCPLKEEVKTLEEAYYTQFGGPFQGGDIEQQLQVKSIFTTLEADSHSIRHIGSTQYPVSTGQNNTLLYKSRQTTIPFPSRLDNHYYDEEVGNYGPKFAEACGASHINDTIPRKEKDPGSFTLPCFINNVCFDNALVDLGASVIVMPLLTYLNLGLGELAHTRLTVELADRTVKYPKGIIENVLVGIGKFTFPIDFIILDMPEDIKVPLILGRPFLSTARAKIDVYKRKITLRVREEKIVFTSIKPASSLIKRVYMLSLRERMDLDLEARLMGETLVLNRSLDPFLEDYIELNDLNEPFELRRNQGVDLMPTIEEGKVIEEFRTRNDELNTGIDDYPSYCDDDKKIHIDYKMVYNDNNVVGALMNVPIFVGTFIVMTDFAVLENMDAYRDEGMGAIIFGEPFLREVGIKAKRFKGMITLYNDNDEVNYQMVRSHPRFKHHTNKQCNKIPPLLKVSENDEKNGVSHAYQKLKGFYKGVLNLGPD
ncbi:putative reverse transcriptase domain-containing protein [Tanacetum coccineum]